MFNIKVKKYLFFMVLMFWSFTVFSKSAKKIRKPAHSSFPYESVILDYQSKNDEFKNLRLHFGPFNKYISLKFPKIDYLRTAKQKVKPVILDCVSDEQNSFLKCLSGCEGGSLKIEFKQGVRLDSLTVKGFDSFTPLACDGSETGLEKPIAQKKDTLFVLKKLSLEK